MKRFFILAVLAVVACSKGQEEEMVYNEQDLGWYMDWAYCGWSEVYNDLEGTVTLVTTYPDAHYSQKTTEKTSVIKPGDCVKLEIGAMAPGVSIPESLTATIKLADGTEILCTNHADNPWSKRFYGNFTQRNEYEIMEMEGKKFRHSWLYVTYHIDGTLVDLWVTGQ